MRSRAARAFLAAAVAAPGIATAAPVPRPAPQVSTLFRTTFAVDHPVMATGAGRALVAWGGGRAAATIMVRERVGDEGPWSAQRVLSTPGASAVMMDAAMNDRGDAVVTWLEHDATSSRVRVAWHRVGEPWAPSETLLERGGPWEGGNALPVDMVTESDGTFTVATVTASRSVEVGSLSASGDRWVMTQASPPSASTAAAGIALAAEPGGRVAVTRADIRGVRLAVRDLGGGWKQVDTPASSAGPVPRDIAFADDGALRLVWSGERDMWTSLRAADGSGWSPVQRVGAGIEPQVRWGGGRWAVWSRHVPPTVWVSNRTGPWRATFAPVQIRDAEMGSDGSLVAAGATVEEGLGKIDTGMAFARLAPHTRRWGPPRRLDVAGKQVTGDIDIPDAVSGDGEAAWEGFERSAGGAPKGTFEVRTARLWPDAGTLIGDRQFTLTLLPVTSPVVQGQVVRLQAAPDRYGAVVAARAQVERRGRWVNVGAGSAGVNTSMTVRLRYSGRLRVRLAYGRRVSNVIEVPVARSPLPRREMPFAPLSVVVARGVAWVLGGAGRTAPTGPVRSVVWALDERTGRPLHTPVPVLTTYTPRLVRAGGDAWLTDLSYDGTARRLAAAAGGPAGTATVSTAPRCTMSSCAPAAISTPSGPVLVDPNSGAGGSVWNISSGPPLSSEGDLLLQYPDTGASAAIQRGPIGTRGYSEHGNWSLAPVDGGLWAANTDGSLWWADSTTTSPAARVRLPFVRALTVGPSGGWALAGRDLVKLTPGRTFPKVRIGATMLGRVENADRVFAVGATHAWIAEPDAQTMMRVPLSHVR